MKEHVRLLVLGDDGVGKSSLISSLVSLKFPLNGVPPILTDVRIPAAKTSANVDITIIDSSSRLSEREHLRQQIALADSLIALYDATRPETLHSLIHLWLPLIVEVLGSTRKPVLVASTKMDLLDGAEEDAEEEEEDRDVAMLNGIIEQFPIVLEVYKVSAMHLTHVERMFCDAISFVVFPIFPIFDLHSHDLTPACRSALLRIFRICDLDNDNLLSDAELRQLLYECYGYAMTPKEIADVMAPYASTSAPSSRGMPFEGFLELMHQSLYNVHSRGAAPWTIMRKYGYEDDLRLRIPALPLPALREDEAAELSDGAQAFLLALARNAYAENTRPINPDSDSGSEAEDCLTWEALTCIWTALTNDEPTPWSSPPSFRSLWPQDGSIAQIVLLSGLPHSGAIVSFAHWLCHWHALAMSDPHAAQVLLFKLGYVDRPDHGLVASSTAVRIAEQQQQRRHRQSRLLAWLRSWFTAPPPPPRPRATARICLLGGNGVGKSSMVWHASDLTPPGATDMLDMERSLTGEKAYESLVVGSTMLQAEEEDGDEDHDHDHANGSALCALMTAVPHDHLQKWSKACLCRCDIAFLLFQVGDLGSLQTAWALERRLPLHMPRMYIAHKADLLHGADALLLQQHDEVMSKATAHVSQHHLPSVHCTSTVNGEGMGEVMQTLRDVLANPELAQPREFKERDSLLDQLMVSQPLVYLSIGALSAVVLYYNKEVKHWIRQLIGNSSS